MTNDKCFGFPAYCGAFLPPTIKSAAHLFESLANVSQRLKQMANSAHASLANARGQVTLGGHCG